ncbi:MAG TPA: cell wall hydrolase [Rhizomicrobium sp.]|jgi:spore germination cell wall hydrolase CwlJ-like protein|nr:cell wall hydrolase [Rhizomicrobium sp.]
MTKKSFEAIRRADHALIGVLALIIATASAACGAAAVYHPSTDEAVKTIAPSVAVAKVVKPAAPTADQVAATAPAQLETIDASNVSNVSAAPIATAPVQSQNPIMAEIYREHGCLSDALYYEARGEGKQGEKAIAEVIFTRLRQGNYGHSICSVVYAGAPRKGCQFSFACDGKSLRQPKSYAAWHRAQILAAQILVGQERFTGETGGATNFHAISTSPEWADDMERTAQIGNHVFYRHLPRTRPL